MLKELKGCLSCRLTKKAKEQWARTSDSLKGKYRRIAEKNWNMFQNSVIFHNIRIIYGLIHY